MARIIYDLASRGKGHYHIYTDLDFWDARKIIKDLAEVRRNFGESPPGDRFPTQIMVETMAPEIRSEIEKRLKRAIASPPRHLIVQSIIFSGKFQFDRRKYYPERWTSPRVLFFTRKRLPTNQPVISSRYKWVDVSVRGNIITIEQRQGTPPALMERPEKDKTRPGPGPACF